MAMRGPAKPKRSCCCDHGPGLSGAARHGATLRFAIDFQAWLRRLRQRCVSVTLGALPAHSSTAAAGTRTHEASYRFLQQSALAQRSVKQHLREQAHEACTIGAAVKFGHLVNLHGSKVSAKRNIQTTAHRQTGTSAAAFHRYSTPGSRPETVAFALPGLLRMKPRAYLCGCTNFSFRG